MPVLAAMCKGEARWIQEPARGSMHNFGDERERLKRSWAQAFQQQQLRKIVKVARISNGQNGAEPFQVDVFSLNVVMARHIQTAGFRNCRIRIAVRNLQNRRLCSLRRPGNQIHDGPLVGANDGGVRL